MDLNGTPRSQLEGLIESLNSIVASVDDNSAPGLVQWDNIKSKLSDYAIFAEIFILRNFPPETTDEPIPVFRTTGRATLMEATPTTEEELDN